MFKGNIKNRAFTLIELAISTLVISILLAGVVTTGLIISKSSDIRDTKETLSTIQEAIENYLIKNQRLPCPASLTLLPTATNFGEELRDGNDECDTTAAGIFTSTDTDAANLVYGTVPIRNLNLSDEFIADNWNNKISYIVDTRFTDKGNIGNSVDGFAFTSGNSADSTLITITSKGTTNTVTDEALFAIISHGENGLGAYELKSSTQKDTTGITTEETDNIYTAAFDPVFVSQAYASGFDDVVFYKTKDQLVKDLDWKDIGCRAAEGTFVDTRIGETVTWQNGEYNQRIQTNNGHDFLCYAKTCGNYGVWGDVSYCKPSTSNEELIYNLPVDNGNLSTTNLKLWLDAADIETISLFSGYNYSNPVVGTWEDKSGNGNDNDMEQSTESDAPLYSGNAINGMPAVYFDGTDKLVKILSATEYSPSTVCIVYKSDGSQVAAASLFSSSENTTKGSFQIDFESDMLHFRGLDSMGENISIGIETSVSTSSNATCFTFNGTNDVIAYLNDGAGTSIPIVNELNGTYTFYKIGVNRGGATEFKGYIAEVLIYGSVLSDEIDPGETYSEIDKIYNYFADKYNL